ncbi:MAG: SDR family oxidoreductase [Pseudoclavibacter sp.]
MSAGSTGSEIDVETAAATGSRSATATEPVTEPVTGPVTGRFSGRSAVVTGAASGIGASIADLLEAEGASVRRWDVRTDDPRVERVDVGDRAAIERAAAQPRVAVASSAAASAGSSVAAEPPAADLLVHAAAIHRAGSVLDLETEPGASGDLDDLLATNLVGTANVLAVFGRRMRELGRGSIVTIASDAAVVPRLTMALYGASKAGAVQLALAAALELAPAGVRCNVVCPGATDTPMQRALWGGDAPPPQVIGGDPATFRGPIPLGRIAEPGDVAQVVAFLLSDAARHVTGQRHLIDGGASLGR